MHVCSSDAIAGQAALPHAKHIAFAAQFQILFGNPEAVGGFPDDIQPGLGHIVERLPVKQQTGRSLRAAPDAAPQLMQLCQPKALGILDHHDGGGGNIDADLDHGCCDQKSDLAGSELRHHAIFFSAAHLAVHEANLVAETRLEALEALLRVGEIDGLGFLHQRADPVDKLSGG